MTDYTLLCDTLKTGPWTVGNGKQYDKFAHCMFNGAAKADGKQLYLSETIQAISQKFGIAANRLSVMIFGDDLSVSIMGNDALEHMRTKGFDIPCEQTQAAHPVAPKTANDDDGRFDISGAQVAPA